MPQKLQSQPHAADTGGVGLSANAFAVVYAEHMPEITRYCRSILRDREDAEDAAQSAMERALKALAGGPAPERMRPWLFTIAQREAIDLLRRRRRAAASAEIDERAPAPHSAPEELSAVRERLAQLLADMRELTPRQREVLVARELGGRSYRSIARSLGISEAAAQQLVLEARRSLRQFEAGRSLACDQVQTWISAHDHAHVRTRRVRAHLRSCQCCRGFQTGIGARRRDFALLLPGLAGGGGWLSSLAAVLGHGAAKGLTAGAVAVTGVTIAAGVPALQADHPNPTAPLPADPAAQPLASLPLLLEGAHPRAELGAPAPAARARIQRAAPRVPAPARPRAQRRRAPGATAAPTAAAGQPPEGDRDRQPRLRSPAAATPNGVGAPADPSAATAAAPADQAAELLPPAKPVLDAVRPITDAVDETLAGVTEAVPSLPDLPRLP